MSDASRLNPDIVPLLSASREERITGCSVDRWVGYERAIVILDRLEQTLAHPRTVRMPCILIVGRASNGKTSILQRFTKRHPPVTTATGVQIIPIVRFDMQETPDESEMWSDLLHAMGVDHREKDPAPIKKRLAKRLLAIQQTRMIVIDEFNHLVKAGRKAGDLLAAVKCLSNELQVSIVAAGTPEAVHALNGDPQMKSRFSPAILDRWSFDTPYVRFLASYERLLPLAHPSNLIHPDLAQTIYRMAGDTIGRTVTILRQAAAQAIIQGTEQITLDILNHHNVSSNASWEQALERG